MENSANKTRGEDGGTSVWSTAKTAISRSISTTDYTDGRRPTPESPELPLDVVFEILKNRRRRMVREELAIEDGKMAIGELAERIAARENRKSVREITSQERKRVYVSLYQCHLPKMDDAGVVQFDKDRGRVALGENVEQLDRYLNLEDATDRRSSVWTWYGGAIVLGIALVSSAVVESVAGVSAPLLALAVLFVVTAGVAVHHAIR